MGNSTFKIPGTGKSVYEGECDGEGRPHGKGKITYNASSFFDGEFLNGSPVRGKVKYGPNDEYEGEIQNNKPHGKGVLKNSKGKY